uniref:acyl-CoA dehydrogenase family protein n=1 Tax=Paractinoplanes polyasparticus TaxID=2856853 RepID=UPI0027E006A3|nr:acyl-CoA dehydrogenase family protein [Actinoplanes polyasparticus]
MGASFGALDATVAIFASGRKPFLTSYARMGESPGARHWLADAASRVHRADRMMLAVAAALGEGGEPAELDAGRLQLDLSRSAQDCRSALDRMLDLHGASGFRMTSPVQRLWRDVSVGSRHPFLTEYLAIEAHGRVLTG